MNKPIYTASVDTLNSQGQGICSVDGLKVFLDYVLPGENVHFELVKQKKKYGLGKLIQVQATSPKRQQPPCPLFKSCGGCQIMHLDPSEQLRFKTQKVSDALRKIGQLNVPVLQCLPSPSTLNYRNKIQLPFFKKDGQIQLGLYQKNSHTPVALKSCAIHGKLGEQVLASVSKLIAHAPLDVFSEKCPKGLRHLLIKTALKNNECLVVFIAGSKKNISLLQKIAHNLMSQNPEIRGVLLNINKKRYNTITGDETLLLAGQDTIVETLNGLSFKISAHAFFQVNPDQAEKLYLKALEYADLNDSMRVLDAYCGIGTLSLMAAKKAKQVHGVECVNAAVSNAKDNAHLNQISNVTFECKNVEDYIESLEAFDVIFLNPPRKGCDMRVLEAIGKNKPKTLVYISCDPATLARDLKTLTSFGFEVKQVQPFDMFPQTSHVETVVRLEPNY